MQLQTERLKLTELFLTDLEDIHLLNSLKQTDEYNTLGIPATKNVTEILLNEWIALQKVTPRATYILCMRLSETNRFIGLIALNTGKANYKIAEVWFKVHPAFWWQGYTTEALIEILKFGFTDLLLHRIEAGCAVENIASIKLLEKVGMTREGCKRKILPIRGEWVDNYFYAILDIDFSAAVVFPLSS